MVRHSEVWSIEWSNTAFVARLQSDGVVQQQQFKSRLASRNLQSSFDPPPPKSSPASRNRSSSRLLGFGNCLVRGEIGDMADCRGLGWV
ncbi:hypothetical protein RHMOL_Rhmol08G0139100 [Rhododendron molle]|uniref:Uncharacterized protein n=1 Tax=Rhododendron molle TaxID=49168 RepID=A0ACC0MNE3_RHOML|nr:hypothetical protein RHMOL_Rhmol08G0139100 [Rhododendron molle]